MSRGARKAIDRYPDYRPFSTDTGLSNAGVRNRITAPKHPDTAPGDFAMGAQANVIASQQDYSPDYQVRTGIGRIQAYRQPLMDRLREALPWPGYPAITPEGSRAALISFGHDGDAVTLSRRRPDAGITITVGRHHLRISPSVFNDRDDVERLIDVLS